MIIKEYKQYISHLENDLDKLLEEEDDLEDEGKCTYHLRGRISLIRIILYNYRLEVAKEEKDVEEVIKLEALIERHKRRLLNRV